MLIMRNKYQIQATWQVQNGRHMHHVDEKESYTQNTEPTNYNFF